MFMVFSKDKIISYLVSLSTVALLFIMSFAITKRNNEIIKTSANAVATNVSDNNETSAYTNVSDSNETSASANFSDNNTTGTSANVVDSNVTSTASKTNESNENVTKNLQK